MLSINGGELLVILLVILVLVGPSRLPQYAQQLASWARAARSMATIAKERVSQEIGDDVEIDWASLDPRRYDPRRIIRDAVLDDELAQQPTFDPPVRRTSAGDRP